MGSRERPGPRYKADLEADIANGVAETDDFLEETTEEDNLGSRKFAFERDLQNYLVQNLGLLKPGLKLYEDEDGGFTGVEFPAGQRHIDILAVGTGFEIEILGERHAAMAVPGSPFDPENGRLRAQAVRGQPWTAAFGPPSGISGKAGRAGSIWSQDGARLA